MKGNEQRLMDPWQRFLDAEASKFHRRAGSQVQRDDRR